MDELERRLTADGSVTLFSSRFSQTFHSTHGAVAEALHVFLIGSGVQQRLASGLPTRILEVGFGTGLNFLLTAEAALTAGSPPLSYLALERNLLPAELVSDLGYESFAPGTAERYLEFRRGLPDRLAGGRHGADIAGVRLELLIGDATEVDLERSTFDAIYHDAFSPDANPELWSREFLAILAEALAPGGVLSTYTVKGEVRRRLQELGLATDRLPGPPGGKRQMLVARKERG